MKPEQILFRPRMAFYAGDGLYELLAPLSEAQRKEELMFLLRLGHAVWSGRFSVAMLNNGADPAAVVAECSPRTPRHEPEANEPPQDVAAPQVPTGAVQIPRLVRYAS